ncbi:MAG: hypothetical protein QXQ90_00920 [Desulfurococcaceae archaeon]
MALREFKVRQLARLKELEDLLLSKYPDKEKRIRELIDFLILKLSNLRTYTLYDYLEQLHRASREFPEFRQVIPKSNEVEELLQEKE